MQSWPAIKRMDMTQSVQRVEKLCASTRYFIGIRTVPKSPKKVKIINNYCFIYIFSHFCRPVLTVFVLPFQNTNAGTTVGFFLTRATKGSSTRTTLSGYVLSAKANTRSVISTAASVCTFLYACWAIFFSFLIINSCKLWFQTYFQAKIKFNFP